MGGTENYTVKVSSESVGFSSAHFVYSDKFTEALHGHNYRVECEVEGALGDDGFVINFLSLKSLLKEVALTFDHKVLIPASSGFLRLNRFRSPSGLDALEVTCVGSEYYVFPSKDVAILEVSTTSSEELAKFIAEALVKKLRGRVNLRRLEVRLWETDSYSACYKARIED